MLPFPQGCCFYKPCPMALHPSPGCAANPLPGRAEGMEIILQGCSNATGIATENLGSLAWCMGAGQLQPASMVGMEHEEGRNV